MKSKKRDKPKPLVFCLSDLIVCCVYSMANRTERANFVKKNKNKNTQVRVDKALVIFYQLHASVFQYLDSVQTRT